MTTPITVSQRGSTSATAMTRTIPTVAVTTLRQYLGSRGRRSHGSTQPATANT